MEAHFAVDDGDAQLPVVYTGILPDLFREKQAVVATGRMQRRHLRRRGSAGQARRDLHAEGSRRQDGRGAPASTTCRRRRRRAARRNAACDDSRTRPLRADPRAAASRRCRPCCRWSARSAATRAWMAVARPAAYAQFALVALGVRASWPTPSSSQDFSVLYVAHELQLAAADGLPLRRGLGRARRLAAAVGADARRCGPLAVALFSRHLPDDGDRARARRDGLDQRRLPAVHAVHLAIRSSACCRPPPTAAT